MTTFLLPMYNATFNKSITISYLTVTIGSDHDNPQPPVIASHPQDVQIPQDHRVTLEVTAYGTEPLCYQWYFENTMISGMSKS